MKPSSSRKKKPKRLSEMGWVGLPHGSPQKRRNKCQKLGCLDSRVGVVEVRAREIHSRPPVKEADDERALDYGA